VLARVGLRGKEDVVAKSLSYGERRALEIALALATEPRLLFLDEPTAGLGAEGSARLAELIRELRRTVTIVVIEHDMKFLFGLADRISVIHWGQVIAEGTPTSFARTRGYAAPASGLRDARSRRHRRVLRETQALFGVSLSVAAGEVVALLGPNGAGKTTTLRAILGLTPARRGSIRFDGHEITRATTHDIARRGDRLGSRRPPHLSDAHRRAQSGDRAKEDAFPGVERKGVLRDLLRARAPDAARMREPLGR
jgi:ABC-type branched-subunit amino acid transport system ATPase component